MNERMGQQAKPVEDMTLDELDEMEDEEDDRILQQYRSNRPIHCNSVYYVNVLCGTIVGRNVWQRSWRPRRRQSMAR